MLTSTSKTDRHLSASVLANLTSLHGETYWGKSNIWREAETENRKVNMTAQRRRWKNFTLTQHECYHSTLTGIICFCICNDLQSILKAHLLNVHRPHWVIGLLYPLDQSLCPMSDLFWGQIPSQVVVVSCARAAVSGYDWCILKCHLELRAGCNDSALN